MCRPVGDAPADAKPPYRLALARFEAALRLIDDVNATLAPHDAIVAMAAAQGFQRITDFHGAFPREAVE
jgi:hypothetical protein